MPPKERNKPKRTVKQVRNKKNTGDIVEFDDIGVMVADDNTVVLAAEGYRAVIDLQDNHPATPDAPARCAVRVRFERAPYVEPVPPSSVGAPGVVPLDPDELIPDE